MEKSEIILLESEKGIEEIKNLIKEKAGEFGFIVRYETDMIEEFKNHEVEVDDEFEYQTLMLCIPQKAYNSVKENFKRTALIMPKQIGLYQKKEQNKTIISFLVMGSEFVKSVLPEDEKIQKSLPASCEKVVELLREVV